MPNTRETSCKKATRADRATAPRAPRKKRTVAPAELEETDAWLNEFCRELEKTLERAMNRNDGPV
jgi:hypothetical protein